HTAQTALSVLTYTVVGVVVITCLYWAQTIFIPLAMALFLTFLLAPLMMRLQRWGLGRAPAVVATLLCALLVAAGGGWGGSGLVVWRVGVQLPTLRDRGRESYGGGGARARPIREGGGRLSERLNFATAPVAPAAGAAAEAPQTVVVKPDSPKWLSRLPSYLLP